MSPLVSTEQIEIDAPLEVVWQTLIDVHAWAGWTRQLTDIRCDEAQLRLGLRFSYRAGGPRIYAQVTAFEPMRSFTFVGRAAGIVGTNTWTLEPIESAKRVRVTDTESISGWSLLLLRSAFARRLPLAQRQWLDDLSRVVSATAVPS